MSIMRGSAAVGFARVMAGVLGALVVALAVFPTVAFALDVSLENSVLHIGRTAEDTAAPLPVTIYGDASWPYVGDPVGRKDSMELLESPELPGSVVSWERPILQMYGLILVEVGDVQYFLVNDDSTLVARVAQVSLYGTPRFYLAGVRVPEYDENGVYSSGSYRYFGDAGTSLASVSGTLPVEGLASLVGTVAVSSMPSVSVVTSVTGSSDGSASAVSMPSTITVTGFGSFDSQALDVALVILIVVFAAVLIYVIRPGDRRG